MVNAHNQLISIVVPVYNESAGLRAFHESLLVVLEQATPMYEIIYCNDGSVDDTLPQITEWCSNKHVKLISLSRNFGKEIATTAGIHQASGRAIITIDADGQHPPELIPEFIDRWKAGSKVVIGVRTANKNEGVIKNVGSRVFYGLFSRMTGVKLLPGSTDFRLIDASVQQEFKRMTERNRITRGLVDWLGYERSYIYFRAKNRQAGDAAYSFQKLFKLAIDSVISLSVSPLYATAYIGVTVLLSASLLGLFMVGNFVFGDPAALHATGGAYMIVLALILIGILMVSQGIIGLYLSHIHAETQNRPLYVVDNDKSVGLT